MQGASGGIISIQKTERSYSIAYVQALEELADLCGMSCEELPEDIRDALHKIPGIEKDHQCKLKRSIPADDAIPRATVAAALAELRAGYTQRADGEGASIPWRAATDLARQELDATITKLGLEDAK